MNRTELFERIQVVSTFDELLQSVNGKDKREIQSKGGNLFEKVSDLIIKFGFCSNLQNDIYDHYEGNINTCKLKKVENLELYLQKLSVLSKGKGGTSDITLQNKKTGKWIFISSKFYLDDSKKKIKDYDVADILAVIREHTHVYKHFEIYLIVNNKKKVLKKIKRCQKTNQHIKDNIHHILDLNDLEIGFQKLKSAILSVPLADFNLKFGNSKIPLELRFHQDLFTHVTMIRISEGEKVFLLGAKARSGKTYCVGGLFHKYYQKFKYLNALVITPAPTETLSQFTDDLFHKFRDFNDIHIVEIRKGKDLETMILQENNIIIVSKQLLDDYVLEKKMESILNLHLDFIVFDENHFHGTTLMSKNILQSYSSPKTVKLFLTATYSKPLNEWNIPTNCQFYWDIEDEQLCKQRNIQGLFEKHGEEVSLFLTEKNKEQILSVYDNMPDLHIITTMMDRKRYDEIKQRIQDTSYGFSNGSLLCGQFPNEVDTLLRYITGSDKEHDFPKKDISIFGRIKKIAIEKKSRTILTNADFTTQLWFLPFGVHMPIHKVSEHLKDRMIKNPILHKYEIKIVNSKKDYHCKDLKADIKKWEHKAKEDGKDGLILLAGFQLSLGVTLDFVDIVFLMNDIISSDKIIQMMYRCMTETIHNSDNDKINNGIKKIGFVVDFNISRVLNTCLDYNVYKKDLNTEQKIKYLVENNLINIDTDLFQGKDNKTKLVEKLLEIWKADPIHSLKVLLKRIEEDIIELDTKDQKMINHCFTSYLKDDKVNVKVKFDEESEEVLATGKESIIEELYIDRGKEEETKEEEEITENINISLTKDVLPFIIPLICILTINTEDRDILEMLNVIKTNPALLRVFEDQSFIWWNKPDIIRFMEAIISKYIRKDTYIYNISIQFKMSLQNLIDKPKELLELINSCLTQKKKEKQEYGEVFTPMTIIFEMLDNLDRYYHEEHDRSIFTERNFKWFDPAVGMGNFQVAVYLRLMDGLKAQIPNDEDRKRHILENMLYMSELNKKNVFICHQIFNMNNLYKINLYEGDTLELDIERVWGIQSHLFDVVLGNPPYNQGGIRSHTGKQLGDKNKTVWTKFVEKSLEWLKSDGFLVFINPLSWLKKSHSLHNDILRKYIIWLKLWDNSQSKSILQADIPISLYILQNTINDSNKTTKITSILKRRNLTTTSNEYLNPKYSIPLAFHNIFKKLMEFIETRNLVLDYKTKTIKSSGTKTKIPTEYTLEDRWAVDTYTIKDGLMVKKATEPHPDGNKRKLIISNKASFAGAFIDEGKIHLTGNHKFYIIGDNLELVQKILNFNIIHMICHYTKYGQDFLDTEAFKFIPDIRKLEITDISEEEFYDLIGFTSQEVNQIKHISTNEDK